MLLKKSQQGWRLLRQGLAYYCSHKKLLLISAVSRGIFFLVATFWSLFGWGIRTGKIDYLHWPVPKVLGLYAAVLMTFWAASILSRFFNAALVSCLIQAEQNQPVRLSEGLAHAVKLLRVIFYYTILHFLFGFGNLFFQRRIKASPRVKQLLSGLNWASATFLFPVVLVNEPAGLQTTIQRSSSLLYQFVGNYPRLSYNFFWILLWARLLSLLPSFVGYFINNPVSIIIGAVVSYLLLLLIAILLNAAQTSISQALYEYIAHGRTMRNFRTQDLKDAIYPGF